MAELLRETFSELEVFTAAPAAAKLTIFETPINVKAQHVNLCAVKNLDGAATLTVEVGIFFRGTYNHCFQKKTIAAGDINTFANDFFIPKGGRLYILALASAGTIYGSIHFNGHNSIPIESKL